MNREKRLNEARRKRQSCLNDSVIRNADRNHAVDVNNTAVKSRPHYQQRIPDTGGYDGFAPTRLNSVQLNAEADGVSERDLLPFHEAGVRPSELYQHRVISNNDDYQRRQRFSNGEKKKSKNYRLDFDQTSSASVVVPVSTEEDGAAGFIDRHVRSIDHQRTGGQGRIDVQHTPSNMSQNHPFHHDDPIDHASAAAAIAASVLASEKVSSLKCIAFIQRVNSCIVEFCVICPTIYTVHHLCKHIDPVTLSCLEWVQHGPQLRWEVSAWWSDSWV